MNPLTIRATNYRTFEDLSLDLPAGCLAVVGENGAGKSSIVNVIDLALFGPEDRTLADYLTDDASTTELEIELTFEHAGELYRVRRGFSAKGRGKTTLDFERQEDPDYPMREWVPETRESQKETQAAIEEVLGLSRETFRASAFLAQGDGAAFTEAQPRDRKRILADVLGLHTWETLLEACRTDKRKTERESTELAGRISLLEESGSETALLEESCSRLRLLVSASESEHAAATASLDEAAVAAQDCEKAEATYRERVSAVTAAEARLRERQAVVERAAGAKLEAVEFQKTLDDVGDVGARLASLEERRSKMDETRNLRREYETVRDRYVADAEDARRQGLSLVTERSQVESALKVLFGKVATLEDPANHHTCDRCGQGIAGEAFEHALLQIYSERDEAEVRIKSYSARIDELIAHERSRKDAAGSVVVPDAPGADQYEELADEIRLARLAADTVAASKARLAGLQEILALVTPELNVEVALLQTALEDAKLALADVDEPEPGALDAAKVAAVTAKAQLDIVAARLTETRTALIRAESALEQAQKVAGDLESARADSAKLQGELDLLALLERAYGRDGIPSLIVESSAIPSIETEANRILAELGTSYRVELRTQKALKSGDGLADTLDVVVIGDAGERAYESFSGGERSRINVALRLALASLLAHRRGAESKVLVLDEVSFLDEAGQAALIDVLLGLRDRFDKLIVVSHESGLRDAPLDAVLSVTKDDGRSRVELVA